MAQPSDFASSPAAVGVDPGRLRELFAFVQAQVGEGRLPGAQVAVAREGKIAGCESFGRAVQGGAERPVDGGTLFCIYSSTKAVVAAAVLCLIEDGLLSIEERAAEVVPAFAGQGKDAITVEQVMLHVGRLRGGADAPAAVGGSIAAAGADRGLAAELAARQPLRVPRHGGALAAGRDDQRQDGARLPRLHPSPAARPAGPVRSVGGPAGRPAGARGGRGLPGAAGRARRGLAGGQSADHPALQPGVAAALGLPRRGRFRGGCGDGAVLSALAQRRRRPRGSGAAARDDRLRDACAQRPAAASRPARPASPSTGGCWASWRATTATRSCAASATASRRAPSGTAAPAVRSPGATPPAGCRCAFVTNGFASDAEIARRTRRISTLAAACARPAAGGGG